ncbi:MAG TPA: MutH/Sau3AI family endonuclease [Polyangiaceae bacterium]|jgi:DNA mismatch repair protein MutH
MAAPASIDELWRRARSLAGLRVADLAAREQFVVDGEAVRTKGKVGELLERALGATGAGAEMDFPELGVELKSVPLEGGKPAESTFVCALPLMDAERAEWATSWARKKLSRVLWVPVHERDRIGESVLWSPSAEQEAVLKDDFEEIIGRIALGDIEDLSAHVGRWLQLRPKAATGSVRTAAPGRDGELVATVPRGFYLRARFVGAILSDPRALP